MSGLEIIRPGLFTTVQDGGRPGVAHLGVPRGGAADWYAWRAALALCGAPPGAAALEFTLHGPTLRALGDLRCCVVGAVAGALRCDADGRPISRIRPCEPFELKTGELLHAGHFPSARGDGDRAAEPTQAALPGGARGYIALGGGVDGRRILGSRSVHAPSGLGAAPARALRAGDRLAIVPGPGASGGAGRAPPNLPWRRVAAWLEQTSDAREIRITPSGQHPERDAALLRRLVSRPWTASPRSDRTGLRLESAGAAAEAPTPSAAGSSLTDAMPRGAVQMTPGGEAIVMLADGPTTGGYPAPAVVIAADWPRAAQVAPRRHLRFRVVTIEEARRVHLQQDAEFAELLAPPQAS